MSEGPLIVALPSAAEQDNAWRGIVETVALEPRIQCEHHHDSSALAYGGDYRARRIAAGVNPDKCARVARVRMGDHLFCAQHAGALLLDLALGHSLARKPTSIASERS